MKIGKMPVVLVAALLLLMAGLCFGGILLFRERKIDISEINVAQAAYPAEPAGQESVENKLMALVKTQEEAEEIAELYGIELSVYSYGVATYVTDKDIQEVLDLSRDGDHPKLSRVQYQHANEHTSERTKKP